MRQGMSVLVLILAAAGLAGCVQQGSNSNQASASDIDQSKLCQVNTWKPLSVANQCQAGQKVLYRPSGSSDSQQAALFAAANCDLRYSVATTQDGVACIYKPISSANSLPSSDTGGSGNG